MRHVVPQLRHLVDIVLDFTLVEIGLADSEKASPIDPEIVGVSRLIDRTAPQIDSRRRRRRALEEVLVSICTEISDAPVARVDECSILRLERRANIQDADAVRANREPISTGSEDLARDPGPSRLTSRNVEIEPKPPPQLDR